ncbi:isochorismatase family protein, partial [bacterium]|nr:isochorismatase family protein [bacterium]
MGIFDRIATLFKSNINDMISKAEDPEKMLDQILVDMRNQLAKAKQQVAAAIADEKRLKDQAEAEFKAAADWESKAMLALKESFTPGAPSNFAQHKSPGSIQGQLMPGLDVQASDLLMDSKRTFDSFHGTPLELLLRAMNRSTVLVAGCNTNT